jgi:hypothetical protein
MKMKNKETMIDMMAGNSPIASITVGEILMISVFLPAALLLGGFLLLVWGVVIVGELAWEGLFG